MAAALIPLLSTILPGILDKVIPDKNAAAKAQAEIITQATGALERSDERQAEINKAEVSTGKGGWRDQAAKLCIYSLGYAWLGNPLATWILSIVAMIAGKAIPALPTIDVELQYTMLVGMLGLASAKVIDLKNGTRR